MREAWTTGGALLVEGALIMSLPMPGRDYMVAAILVVACVVFAFGWRGRGSVAGRRLIPTAALVLLGVVALAWTIAVPIVAAAEPEMTGEAARRVFAFATTGTAIEFALALLASIGIVRARVVPDPWRWVPVGVLAAMAALSLAGFVVLGIGATAPSPVIFALSALDGIVAVLAVLALGVAALVLASRLPTPGVAETPARAIERSPHPLDREDGERAEHGDDRRGDEER